MVLGVDKQDGKRRLGSIGFKRRSGGAAARRIRRLRTFRFTVKAESSSSIVVSPSFSLLGFEGSCFERVTGGMTKGDSTVPQFEGR